MIRTILEIYFGISLFLTGRSIESEHIKWSIREAIVFTIYVLTSPALQLIPYIGDLGSWFNQSAWIEASEP